MMFTTKDPLNRVVSLKRATWEYKVCNYYGTNSNGENGNCHKDMRKYYDKVIDCIENPQYILQDTRIEVNTDGEVMNVIATNRQEYYKSSFDENEKLMVVKALVEFDENNFGDIVTTHKMNGKFSGIKKGGGIIYDSTKRTI